MNLPAFILQGLQDDKVRENFSRLLSFLRAETPLQGFQLVTARFTSLGEQQVPHTLGFIPQDIIVTQQTGLGILLWNYSKFTATQLSVTVEETASPASPTTVRLLAGTLNRGAK
jgi:hypothetical protein